MPRSQIIGIHYPMMTNEVVKCISYINVKNNETEPKLPPPHPPKKHNLSTSLCLNTYAMCPPWLCAKLFSFLCPSLSITTCLHWWLMFGWAVDGRLEEFWWMSAAHPNWSSDSWDCFVGMTNAPQTGAPSQLNVLTLAPHRPSEQRKKNYQLLNSPWIFILKICGDWTKLVSVVQCAQKISLLCWPQIWCKNVMQYSQTDNPIQHV